MSALVTGVVIAAGGLGYGISSGEKAKKTAKHAKERAVGKSRELSDKESKAARMEKAQALTDKRKRLTGVARNLNFFGSSFGDQAKTAAKIFTGQ